MKIENIKVYLQVKFSQNQSFNMLTDRVDYILCSISRAQSLVMKFSYRTFSVGVYCPRHPLLCWRRECATQVGVDGHHGLLCGLSLLPHTVRLHGLGPEPQHQHHRQGHTQGARLSRRHCVPGLGHWPAGYTDRVQHVRFTYRPCTICKIYIQTVYKM